jgi:hypothetical protein
MLQPGTKESVEGLGPFIGCLPSVGLLLVVAALGVLVWLWL